MPYLEYHVATGNSDVTDDLIVERSLNRAMVLAEEFVRRHPRAFVFVGRVPNGNVDHYQLIASWQHGMRTV